MRESKKINDETCYRILKLLQKNPNVSQRELAEQMGFSVGKINYCLKVLVQIGFVTVIKIACSRQSSNFAYEITPKGKAEKVKVGKTFLMSKLKQYENIKSEIAALELEVNNDRLDP